MSSYTEKSHWIAGDGSDLPHGTVCIVLSDDEPFLREAHPLVGRKATNWWPLTGRRGEMIPGEEVTAYVVVGPLPKADQPAPTETGPNRDWNLKVRISHATTFNGREMGSSSGSWTLAQLHDLLKAEHSPQGAPPMLCLAKSKECGGRPCMLPMGHEGNHANWDCDPVER